MLPKGFMCNILVYVIVSMCLQLSIFVFILLKLSNFVSKSSQNISNHLKLSQIISIVSFCLILSDFA